MEDHDAVATIDTIDTPPVAGPTPATPIDEPTCTVLGVTITDTTRRRAVDLVESMIARRDGRTRSVFFVNAHTLNLAAADRDYRRVLNSADCVFGDGTGVRWAARLQGNRISDNLNGTDFTPELLRATAGNGYRLFLLGADDATAQRAAEFAASQFPGWTIAGWQHGYLDDTERTDAAIDQIRLARPDLLLVAMGNPLQEEWIDRHRAQLDVPVCMGVGGLFDFWAENVSRAPRWLRKLGHEWIWRLGQQPLMKARRYMLGNPLFLARAICDAWKVRRRTRANA